MTEWTNRVEQRYIRRVQKKQDRNAAEQIIRHYYYEMYRYFYKQTLNVTLAFDLTQELMIRMLKSLPTYDAKRASFRTWLYRIASRHLIDYYRSKAYQHMKRTQYVEDWTMYEAVEELTRPEVEERYEEVMGAIQQLSPDLQMIVRLKWFGAYTLKEIAEQEQLPLSTVKTKYYRALQMVRSTREE